MQRPKVLTVRNIPTDVADAIARRARESGTSMNRAAIELLRAAVAPRRRERRGPSTPTRHDDLDELVGAWSERDADEFDAALHAQRRIHPKDWR